MSVSMQDVCCDWANENPGFRADWEYDMELDSYKVSVEHEKIKDIVVPGYVSVSTSSTIPAYGDDIGSAVILLVLDVLKTQLVLYEDYKILI